MLLTIKNLLTTNTPLKVCSAILGYSFWCMFSGVQPITQELTVPLCLYDIPATIDFNAPETVTVTLAGRKNQLANISRQDLAVHINARDLSLGTHPIELSAATLFLPESIKLVHYSPVPVIITTTVKK